MADRHKELVEEDPGLSSHRSVGNSLGLPDKAEESQAESAAGEDIDMSTVSTLYCSHRFLV